MGLSGEVVLDELLSVLCVVDMSEPVVAELSGFFEVSVAFESDGDGVSADGEATLLDPLLLSDGVARLPELDELLSDGVARLPELLL